MSPPRKHRHPPNMDHHHPEWILNDERERTVKEFGEFLEKLGHRLFEDGEVTISGEKITPPQYA